MKKQILLTICMCFTVMLQASVSKTVNLITAGSLWTSLTYTELNTVTNLTITGTINAIDFLVMRENMPLLAVLDISNVTISAYTGTQGTVGTTSTTYSANEIPRNAFYFRTSYSGKTTLTNITISNSVISIGDVAFCGCNRLTSITISSSLTSIGDQAFNGCESLTNITIPNSVTSIGEMAFYNCNKLSSLTIPNSLTSIGKSAFNGCSALTEFVVQANNSNFSSINGVLFNKNQTSLILYPFGKQGIYTIPSSVTSIGVNAFNSCKGLTSITIPNSVTGIGGGAFSYCSALTSLIIPDSVTSIGVNAFYACTGLTGNLTIPNSVTFIGDGAFQRCIGLTNIIIPNSVTSIGVVTFGDCTGLTIVTIPNSIKTIRDNAFENCTGLISVTIPDSVTYISRCAFTGCTRLMSITIPNSVTGIGDGAFSYCTGLTSINANSTLPINLSNSTNVFYLINKTSCTLHVPVGSKSDYKTANQWKDFTNIVETTTAVPTIINSKINLYPNPIIKSFQISGLEGIGTMTLSDLNGKTILSKQVIDNENISIGALPKGIYILKVITNEGIIERKIVKK